MGNYIPCLSREPAAVPQKKVVLIGLMGCGKSTVGKSLAEALGTAFADSDAEIVKREGIPVPEIFEKRGEPEFRRIERETIRDILAGEGLGSTGVVATGGGAFMDPTTRETLKSSGAAVVFLRVELDVLVDRCEAAGVEGRPLLRDGARPALEKLMKARYPTYSEATIIVDNDGGPETLGNLVNEIISRIEHLS
eukprot:TRINITY_DN65149_c0_g1_i1.p1 TRINITY_DN65149_c0_g1~~TRINITY_DN65149_c0_g1_i1.p1  ORF type:complete len:194 (+),score=33.08 TRINITY_DN65149_c0_g1_i1:114-695(+)